MELRIAARTSCGPIRRSNEDRFLIAGDVTRQILSADDAFRAIETSSPVFIAVSDGMGGSEAGRYASEFVLRRLIDRLFGVADVGNLTDVIQTTCARISEELAAATAGNPDLEACGADSAFGIWDGGLLHLARIGSSTIYLARHRELYEPLRQLRWMDFIWLGAVPESFPRLPESARFIADHSCFGESCKPRALLAKYQPRIGDRLVLCTDGLSDHVDRGEIERVVFECPTVDELCHTLFDIVEGKGGPDNTTVVVTDFDDFDMGECRIGSVPAIEMDVTLLAPQFRIESDAATFVRSVVRWHAANGSVQTAVAIAETVPVDELRKLLLSQLQGWRRV